MHLRSSHLLSIFLKDCNSLLEGKRFSQLSTIRPHKSTSFLATNISQRRSRRYHQEDYSISQASIMKLSLFGLLSWTFLPVSDGATVINKVSELLELHDEKFEFELADPASNMCFQASADATKQLVGMKKCDLADRTMKFTYHYKTKTLRPAPYPDHCVFQDTLKPSHIATKDCTQLTNEEEANKPFDFGADGRIRAHSGECVTPDQYATIKACDPADLKQVFEVESKINLPLSQITKVINILNGGSKGDPHFTTWSGAHFDFHGGCDLILVDNPGFSEGLGMRVYLRTKIHDWWSSIEGAVVQIGKKTLEVAANSDMPDGMFWVNGDVDFTSEAQERIVSGEEWDLSGFAVHFSQKADPKQTKVRVDIGHGDAVGIEIFKGMLQVNLHAHTEPPQFAGSYGLMGSFPGGHMLARDNTTRLEDDPIAFGKEWQVSEDEPSLFHEIEGVQSPETCAMPMTDGASERKRRRLGEALLTNEEAEEACAHARENEKKHCVFDVLATNDKDMAGAY